MPDRPIRQVTPPAIRVWLAGIAATALAASANAGWLWICVNLFNWKIVVPETLQGSVYVDASVLRVTLATAVAGLIATLVAVGLAKAFIGPRIWFLVLGIGAGIASVYGALTLADTSFSVKFSLSVMHLLATFLIVLPIAEALKIRDSDLHRADLRYHEAVDNKNATDAAIITGVTSAVVETPQDLNETLVVPTDTLALDADGSTDRRSD